MINISRPFLGQFLQLMALLLYVYLLTVSYGANRIYWHLPVLLLYTCTLDTLCFYCRHKRWRLPLTGLIAGTALFILLGTRYIFYPYLIAASVAILTKFLVTYENKHVFNPANIGLLTAALLMPDKIAPSFEQWVGPVWHLMGIVVLGFSICLIVRRLTLALSYMISFLMLNVLRGFLSDLPLAYLVGPAISFAGIVFTFHMITDPKTTPYLSGRQIKMGCSIALVDFLFRLLEVTYAPFLALALVSAMWPVFYNSHINKEPVYA